MRPARNDHGWSGRSHARHGPGTLFDADSKWLKGDAGKLAAGEMNPRRRII